MHLAGAVPLVVGRALREVHAAALNVAAPLGVVAGLGTHAGTATDVREQDVQQPRAQQSRRTRNEPCPSTCAARMRSAEPAGSCTAARGGLPGRAPRSGRACTTSPLAGLPAASCPRPAACPQARPPPRRGSSWCCRRRSPAHQEGQRAWAEERERQARNSESSRSCSSCVAWRKQVVVPRTMEARMALRFTPFWPVGSARPEARRMPVVSPKGGARPGRFICCRYCAALLGSMSGAARLRPGRCSPESPAAAIMLAAAAIMLRFCESSCMPGALCGACICGPPSGSRPCSARAGRASLSVAVRPGLTLERVHTVAGTEMTTSAIVLITTARCTVVYACAAPSCSRA